MLVCALIVWLLQPLNWDPEILRETFLTESECLNNIDDSTHVCIKIDKRIQLTYKEWNIDNCSLSEHEWNGYGLKK